MLTNQEIFTKCRNHLLAQNAKSLRAGPDQPASGHSPSACAYRGVDGLKCAAGIFIPDEQYSPLLEGRGVRATIFKYPGVFAEIDFAPSGSKSASQLLVTLQDCHDSWPVSAWRRELGVIARDFDLVVEGA